MSYASFTKTVPDLIKSVPQKLLQPTGIAVMASVGIHALVAVVLLPHWSMSSEKKSPPVPPVRNVQLLQLTPTEQNRIPQLVPSPLSSIPNQLPALSSLPSSGASSLPSLPSQPSKDFSLLNLPPISPLPSLGKIPSLSQSPRQQLNLNKLSIRNSPSLNDLSTPKQTTSSSNQLTSLAKRQLTPIPSSQLPPPPRTPWPTTDLSKLPSVEPAPLPAFDSNQTLPPSPLLNQVFPPPPLPNTPPPYGTGASGLLPQQSYSTSIATGAFPATPATGDPTQTNRTSAVVPSQRNLPNNSSDTNKDFIRNGYNYLAQNQIASRPRELQISRNYPQKVRSAGETNNGAVVVAVKVDERGKILSDSLRVIGSSFADGNFDGDAKDTVQGHSFPATGKPEAYFVKVQFNNDSSVIKSSVGSPTPANATGSDNRTSNEKPSGSDNRTSSNNRTGLDNRTSTEKPSGSDNRTSTEKPSGSDNRTSAEKPSGSDNRTSTEKPSGSDNRTSAEKPSGSDSRTSAEKPSGSDNRTSAEKPSGSDSRTSAEKPSGSDSRTSAEKPSGLAEVRRPNSAGTFGQSFVERLRRDFKEKPSSNLTKE